MIETHRLILHPLNYNQLEKYILADNSLEKELNLNSTVRTISPELKEALEQTIIPNVEKAGKNYLYVTLWTIISKDEEKMVGDLCIAGEPNAHGEIEIGYGTYEAFQNKGYMTEAVGGMINWAKKQQKVGAIIASTNKDNPASFKVLIKNNFVKTSETKNLYNWKLVLK